MGKRILGLSILVLVFALGTIGVYAGYRWFQHQPVYSLSCGIVTPAGPVPTLNIADLKEVEVSEFGVIRARGFIYTPASGEVCFLNKKGE